MNQNQHIRLRIHGETIFVVFAAVVVEIIILLQPDIDFFVSVTFGSVACLFIIVKILLGDSLRFNYLTIPSFFMLIYIIMMPYGTITTFQEMDHPVRYTYFLAIFSVLVTFPLGVVVANLLLPSSSGAITRYVKSQFFISSVDRRFVSIVFVLFLSSIPILAMYFLYSQYVQLIEVIKNYPTDIDIMVLKFAGADDLPRGVQYAFESLRRFILPLCVLFVYLMASAGERSWKILFWPFFVGGLLVSALTLDRAPPVAFVVMLILAYILRKNQRPAKTIRNVKLLIILAIAMVVGGIVSVLQYQSEFTADSVFGSAGYVLTYRILQDTPYMASKAFEAFNESTGFLYGKYMRIFSLLPGFVYVQSLGEGVYSPAAPAGFVADLWRNFGWPGVILGTMFLGFVCQFIQIKVFVRKSVLTLSINVILMIGSIWMIPGNILGVMSTSIIVFGTIVGIRNAKALKFYGFVKNPLFS